jgi:hypothetical protein
LQITAVAVGDVRNSGRKSIVCASAEGRLHIFDLDASADIVLATDPGFAGILPQSAPPQQQEDLAASTGSLAARVPPAGGSRELPKPETYQVPINVSRILIADSGTIPFQQMRPGI